MRDEPWLEEHVQRLLKTCGRSLAVDIGANHGTWSEFLKPLFHRVIAVEPDERCKEIQGTEFYRVLVGKDSRQETLWLSSSPEQNHVGEAHPLHGTGGRPVQIFQKTFDELCAGRTPDFVKIDVEGAEDGILSGVNDPHIYARTAFLIESHNREAELSEILGGWGRGFIKIPHPDPCPQHCWICVPSLT